MRGISMVFVFAVFFMLAGCGGNSLIAKYENSLNSYDDTLQDYWISFRPPRGPHNSVEDAVIRAAQTRKNIPLEDSEAVFIFKDATGYYVDVVEGYATRARLSEKEVTRYRVVDGKISAKSAPSEEIFPDADFERTVLLVAVKARSIDRVLLYEDGGVHFSMSGQALGSSDCATLVNIYNNAEAGTEPIAKKVVNFCFR